MVNQLIEKLPWSMRRLLGRPPRLIAECGVHGEPGMIARLWEGERFYQYTRRRTAR